eukprot:TRINITY_DN13261_c0_g1_i1.p1 TRINITY_DN13261_c0_g1~~TRINITY_DN13261_c0_g1_i1.p1  ORF type:complete len:313 (+),score=65.65 TRINITY_DN13261_c0_g1_i1:43-981(+)
MLLEAAAPDQTAHGVCDVCGWLEMDVWSQPGADDIVTYLPRWYVLREGALLHFRDSSIQTPPGDAISMPGATVVRDGGRSLLLRAGSGPLWLRRRSHRLRAETNDMREVWLHALRRAASSPPVGLCTGVGRLLQAAAAPQHRPILPAAFADGLPTPALEQLHWIGDSQPRCFGGSRTANLVSASGGRRVWVRYGDARFLVHPQGNDGVMELSAVADATDFPFLSRLLGVATSESARRTQYWFIYDHVDGTPILDRGSGVDVRVVAAELALALSRLHRRHLVHGRLTPHKVVLDSSGRLPAAARCTRPPGTSL